VTDEQQQPGAEFVPEAEKAGRTGPGQFLREVRSELKRVHWPSRREVTQYTIVVLIAVSLLTLYIFGLDQMFGQFVFWIFG
jgi:preprotein translocase subunit SecE